MATSRLQIVPPRATPATDRVAVVTTAIAARERGISRGLRRLQEDAALVAAVAETIASGLGRGGKVLTAGNGGSAAEAQHFAAELVGRFKRERPALPALSLTADSAVLTAIANDYGYAEVFARQVRAWGTRGDVLVLFSTSGESPNVLAAAAAARELAMTVVAITGGTPNRLAAAADLALAMDAVDAATVQELHAIALHLICDLVETACAGGRS